MLQRKKVRCAGAVVLVLALCVSIMSLDARSADASDRRRNVVLGGGIIGAIIVKELNSRKYGETRASRPRKLASPKRIKRQAGSTRQQPTAKGKAAQTADTAKAPQPEAVAGGPAPVAQAVSAISAPEEITSAQEHLRYMGYDVPQASGILDLKTKMAMMQFQESIGASTTGVLTVEQLQALFLKAAERHAQSR